MYVLESNAYLVCCLRITVTEKKFAAGTCTACSRGVDHFFGPGIPGVSYAGTCSGSSHDKKPGFLGPGFDQEGCKFPFNELNF